MIKLQSDRFEIDLSTYGVVLKEQSNIFSDKSYGNNSLPFLMDADSELLEKLGILTIDNISDVDTKVKCRLVLEETHFPAFLYLGEIIGSKIQCDITYGEEQQEIYTTKLKDLPWPKVIALQLHEHAKQTSTKSWPATPYNFPMLYNPKINGDSNYALFEDFVNNHDGNTYLQNEVDNTGAEPVYINRNVIAPFPYLLEILRFGYSQIGKKTFGKLFEDETLKKTLFIPDNFLEKFKGTQYQKFSFGTPDTTEIVFNRLVYGVYEKSFTPTAIGTYDIDFSFDLDPVLASYFEFNIFRQDALSQERTLLTRFLSKNNRVKIEDSYTVNVESADQYDTIVLQLKLRHTTNSIANFNNVEYNFKGGKLNEFPDIFSLADFMPDMTFGEYENLLKNWLNLDINVQNRYVEINFVQDSILKRNRVDHSHLEDPEPSKKYNSNRFYKLSYADNSKVLYNINGQVFSDLEEEGSDVIELNMEVQPAVVESNKNIITAVAPKEKSKLDFCVYDGLNSNGKPTASSELIRELFLQAIFVKYWQLWLSFRLNSKTFKDSFKCSVFENITINDLSIRYNELHVLKSLNKKFLSEKVMQVDMESETF